MTKIGRKWLIKTVFQHVPPKPPIQHTYAPHRLANFFQVTYIITHSAPHPQDPTQLPYRPPQLLIHDQKQPKNVQKHVFLLLHSLRLISYTNALMCQRMVYCVPTTPPKVPLTLTNPHSYPMGHHTCPFVAKNGKNCSKAEPYGMWYPRGF
jgi:hypothetical protein